MVENLNQFLVGLVDGVFDDSERIFPLWNKERSDKNTMVLIPKMDVRHAAALIQRHQEGTRAGIAVGWNGDLGINQFLTVDADPKSNDVTMVNTLFLRGNSPEDNMFPHSFGMRWNAHGEPKDFELINGDLNSPERVVKIKPIDLISAIPRKIILTYPNYNTSVDIPHTDTLEVALLPIQKENDATLYYDFKLVCKSFLQGEEPMTQSHNFVPFPIKIAPTVLMSLIKEQIQRAVK